MTPEQKIVDLLHEYLAGNIDDAGKIKAALRTLDIDVDLDEEDFRALAAAVEYFSADEPPTAKTIRKAAYVIEDGDYLLFEGVEDYNELGYAFFKERCGKSARMYLPDWVEDYIDFEALGEEVANRGEFTLYGFFSPDERSF